MTRLAGYGAGVVLLALVGLVLSSIVALAVGDAEFGGAFLLDCPDGAVCAVRDIALGALAVGAVLWIAGAIAERSTDR